jgi:Helix-turn-helix domain
LQISEFLTPADVAQILKVHVKTIIRRFEDFPGVVDLGTEETRYKRRYRVLRIPKEALEKFILEHRQ